MGREMVGLTMQTSVVVILAVLISAMLAEEPTPELKSSRKPEVYLISTTTSTSTLSVCFIIFSTANGLVSCKKKKRSIGFLEDKPVDVDDTQSELIAPNPSLKTQHEEALAKLSEIADVTGGKNDDDDYEEREARFFNYWMTTTVTTTYTSYTSTSSLGSLYCTPIGYENLNCPANG